ncbi:MAG: COG1470 family protein, partial [Candidatus Bipolaricaulaceae bacterium]
LAVIGVVVGILVTRPTGDFTLPPTLSLAVPITKSGTVEIPLTPPAGKSFPKGDITFSVKETLPTGVKVTFNPAKITAKGDEKSLKTTMAVEAASAAKTGGYTLTVVAKGGGVTRESKLVLTVQVAPDYSLEVSPTAVTVKQGATATATVNIKRNETMKDAVDLAVSGAPTGVKVTVDPAKVPADKASATLKIEVPAATEAKDYTLTITGKAAGFPDKTATLKLTVQPVDFSLKAEPAVVTIQPGASAQVKLTITRTNLTDPVAFAAKNVPAGLSVTFNPVSATGNETLVTISAAADVAPGSYSFTVEGASAGKTRTVTISVTVGG